MPILRTCFILIIAALFGFQTTFAQSGWSINQTSGTGDLISVFFTSSDNGWIAGDDGFLAYTEDGGKTWQKRILNTAANINEIYFRNDDNGYLVAGRKMFITSDAGKSWNEEIIVKPNEFTDGIPEFYSIRFNSKNQGFIIGAIIDKNNEDYVIGSLLLRTVDGGSSWSRIVVPTKAELIHLDFDGKSHGWIVGDMGTILATTDNGNTWNVQNSGTDEVLRNVDFRDEKDGYVVGTNGTILRTVDGGQTWTKIESNFDKSLNRVDFADDKNGWIVGSDGVILRSTDKGMTWVRQESQTENSLYGLFIVKKYGWSVGKSGVIIKYER
ncbi:MAG: YCF48-related protein [Pyrinomonadaceae bacterium]